MDFNDKIDKILRLKGIKLYKLAEISGLGNTLEKAYQDNREMKRSTTDRLIQNLGIIPESWDSEEGPEFKAGSHGKHTHEQNGPAITENPLGIGLGDAIRKVVEDNTEYLIIPKLVLEGKYRLVALEQIQKDAKELEDKTTEIMSLHELIKQITHDITARPININFSGMEKTE